MDFHRPSADEEGAATKIRTENGIHFVDTSCAISHFGCIEMDSSRRWATNICQLTRVVLASYLRLLFLIIIDVIAAIVVAVAVVVLCHSVLLARFAFAPDTWSPAKQERTSIPFSLFVSTKHVRTITSSNNNSDTDFNGPK